MKLVYITQNLKLCATAQCVQEVKSECDDNMEVNEADKPVDDAFDDDICEETEGDESDDDYTTDHKSVILLITVTQND